MNDSLILLHAQASHQFFLYPYSFPYNEAWQHYHACILERNNTMIKISLNDTQAVEKLHRIASQLKQPRKLYGVLGETLKKSTRNGLSRKLILKAITGSRFRQKPWHASRRKVSPLRFCDRTAICRIKPPTTTTTKMSSLVLTLNMPACTNSVARRGVGGKSPFLNVRG